MDGWMGWDGWDGMGWMGWDGMGDGWEVGRVCVMLSISFAQLLVLHPPISISLLYYTYILLYSTLLYSTLLYSTLHAPKMCCTGHADVE